VRKSDIGTMWALMIQTLTAFSQTEKSYYSFGFLELKWFGRHRDVRRFTV